MIHKWDSPTHNPKKRILDVPGIGRYLVQRERPRAAWFVVLLNGKKTSYGGDTLEAAMKSVERVVEAQAFQS